MFTFFRILLDFLNQIMTIIPGIGLGGLMRLADGGTIRHGFCASFHPAPFASGG